MNGDRMIGPESGYVFLLSFLSKQSKIMDPDPDQTRSLRLEAGR